MSAIRRGMPGLLALAVVIGVVAGPVSPAQAHEQIAGSTPAVGERLESAPAEIVLDFSGEVLTVGALVLVVDASGRDWAGGQPVYDGAAVRLPVEPGMPDAGYEVRWRVVSGDGHPISGLIPFTVGAGEEYTSLAPGDTPAAPPTVPDASDPEVGSGLLRIGLIGLGGAALAVAFFVTLEIIMRRRRAAAAAASEGAPHPLEGPTP